MTDTERAPVALVTGGANGIGLAVVHRLAADGMCVAIVDIDRASGEDVERALSAEGHRVRFFRADIRVAADVAAAVGGAADEFGGLDAVVNNAGVNTYFDPAIMTESDWDDAFAVDLKAAWLVCRAAFPWLDASDRAAVVNISSIHARLTTTGMFPYAAAKSAMEGLTRGLALDWAKRGIRVNAVAPGWTRTHLVEEWLGMQPDPSAALADVLDAHPLGYIAEPEDVAAVVAFLLDPRARAVTGAVYAVDCGLSVRFAS